MNEAAQLSLSIDETDPKAAEQLLPLIYKELRSLAAVRLMHENPGHTLQATALVHEVYLRLLGGDSPQEWKSRAHFFAAAAEAMRRILVESARRRRSLKRGGKLSREALGLEDLVTPETSADLLALDESLDRLTTHDKSAAELIKLRFFSGLSAAEAAEVLDISPRTANRLWVYAKAWLYRDLGGTPSGSPGGGR